jgi:hypothetical protein
MTLLTKIINRLNERISGLNLFTRYFGLSQIALNETSTAWVTYSSNGQLMRVTDYDTTDATLFWSRTFKVDISKTETLSGTGCKYAYKTTFPLTAHAVVKRNKALCDAGDTVDYIANKLTFIISGIDTEFKHEAKLMSYEVVPTGYSEDVKTLPGNYEYACVSVFFNVEVVTNSLDCFDNC